jgi:hypothetical protein
MKRMSDRRNPGAEKTGCLTYKPKRCIKNEADMLKNPAKAIKFYSDTHDNPPESPLYKGGIKGGVVHFAERLAGQPEGL